jgi:hypothetical protein
VLGSPGILSDGATDAQSKNWQPVNGNLTFTIHSAEAFDPNARILVCLRWRTQSGNAPYTVAWITNIDLSAADRSTVKISIIVPHPRMASTQEVYLHALPLHLVPQADVHILIKGPATDPVEVDTIIGITHPFFAGMIALAVFVITFGWLWFVVSRRLRMAGFPSVNPALTVISTPDGYASLSQFQIVLWTFVVLLSAVYVMALSGSLIEITTGTLVLLGISGATTVASRISAQSGAADAKDSPPAAAAAAATATSGGTPIATAAKDEQRHSAPMWSDLITNTTEGKLEIDVTRVQMLFFTLITAVFVVLRVFTTYVIPEIPAGFQILMGISNAVYMGSKVAQK